MQESVDLVTSTINAVTDKHAPSVLSSGTTKPFAWWTPYCQWAWERKHKAFFFKGGSKVVIIRRATKCCVQVCQRAFTKHQFRLNSRLARAKGSREFWQTMKTYSGRGGGGRKAAPPADHLAKYFSTKKMSLLWEEGKEVLPLESPPLGSRKLRGFKITHPKIFLKE